MSTSDKHIDAILETNLSRTFTPQVLRRWIERNPTDRVVAHTISLCPIAKCLQDEMDDPTLTTDGMCVYTPGGVLDFNYREAALPNWASSFAQSFDREFSGLEVQAKECLRLIPEPSAKGQKPVTIFRHGVGSIDAPA